MKKLIFAVVACVTALSMLSSSTAQPPAHAASGAQVFVVPLSGDEEVPAVDTDAFGIAIFTVRPNDDAIHYIIITSPMPDITQAHIHLAPAGQNGGIVAWLFGEPDNIPPTASAGLLASGSITADDLVGALEGESLDALLDAMSSGGAYVNVHTSTVPSGEIRGQI